MRHFGGFGLALLSAAGLFAQGNGIYHSPVVSSGFGTVSHPGANAPIRPYRNPGGTSAPRTTAAPVYAYPVYVGGYGYLGGYTDPSYGQDYSTAAAPAASGPAPQDQPAQPSMTIVYPPQQTIIVNQYPSPDGGPPIITMQQGPGGQYGPQPAARRAPAPTADDDASPNEAPHYLIAFKDHSIYSAMAYWVDGDTLHYFTTGNTHNQASLSLVDRDLTDRLNHEAGVDMRLPPPPASTTAAPAAK